MSSALLIEKDGSLEHTQNQLPDEGLMETVIQMVQLEFLELELMQQETKVRNTINQKAEFKYIFTFII